LEAGLLSQAPEIYGFIPDGAWMRVLVFAELFTLHSAHAMVRTVTIALLVRKNSLYLVVYMVSDFCVFLSYKIARGDLVWFAPGA
jgi:hypothetical protein